MINMSIIIVNHNTREILKNCLNSIISNTKDINYEIIVIDNNSQDGSPEFIKKTFSEVRLIKNKENSGFGKANNLGASVTKGEYLFFLNSDTIIKDNSLNKLFFCAKKNKELGMIAPELLLKNGEKQEGAYGAEPTLSTLVFGKLTNSKRIDWLSGAALLIRKSLFEKIQGFDENFFMYFEDVDLSLRVRKLGYGLAICDEAKIVHLVGRSIKISQDRKRIYYASQNYFYKKHYGFLKYLIMKIIRFPYKLTKNIK